MSAQLQVGTVFTELLKSEQDSSCSPSLVIHVVWAASSATIKLFFPAATLDHDDAKPLTVLFSVLALSLMERTPESMGEETVQSIRERGVASVEPESKTKVGTESTATEAAESCPSCTMSVTVRVVDSGVEVCTMSVTGRMVGIGAVVLTVSMTGRVEESAEGIWPESMGGGETAAGLEGLRERGDISLTQGEVESNCGGWESMTGGMGESLVEGVDVDSSAISNWMGMSECALMEGGGSMEMLQSVIGTGGGVEDGGGLSCIDGVGESAEVA